MTERLFLAANLIPETLIFGHLQIVFRDSDGHLLENETTSPGFPYFFGDWEFPEFGRAHDSAENTPRYGTSDYAIVGLELRAEQTAQHVWQLLEQVYNSLRTAGSKLDYDVQQNSNSYVNTALSIVGISVFDYLPAVTPDSVSDFPGVGTNVLFGAKTGGLFSDYSTKISLSIAGTAGNDYVQTGMGNDTLFGAAGNDTILAGSGNDTLRGNSGDDVLKGEQGIDWIEGGTGYDLVTGGSGSDVFAFALGDDTMTITDFEPGIDDLGLLNLRPGFTVADLHPFVSQQGGDVVIRSGIQEVRFEDTQLSELSAGDVFFA